MSYKIACATTDGGLWVLNAANIVSRVLTHGVEQAEGSLSFVFMSARTATDVWAVDAAGSVFKLVSTPFSEAAFGRPWHISAGSDGQIWAIDGSGHTKVWNNTEWVEKDNGGLTIMQISLSNSSNVWGIDGGGWWGGPGKAAKFDGTRWVKVDSPVLRWISVGPDNSVWAVDDATKKQLYKYENGQWVKKGPPYHKALWQIAAVGNDEVYAWFSTLALFTAGRWVDFPDTSNISFVGASVDGTLIDARTHKLLRLAGTGVWETLPYQGENILAVFPVNGHLLYVEDLYRNMQWLGNAWQQMPGSSFANVSVAADGTIWGTTTTFNVMSFDGNAWQSRPGTMRLVSAGGTNQIIGLSETSAVLSKWDGSAWQSIALPSGEATLLDASIGSDGTIYVVGASNKTYFLSSGTWKLSSAGNLIQVHVADHDHVSGITTNDSQGQNHIWLGGTLDRLMTDPAWLSAHRAPEAKSVN